MSDRQLTILVVEDNPIIRKMLRVTLEGAGYVVREAGDGREALEAAAGDPPALIVQDVRLPGMSGFDLAERLRALPQCADIPIIAMSGMLTRDEEKRIAAVLFHEFLAKPVAPSRLLEAIRAHLPAAPESAESSGSRGRILVADDEPIQRKLTVRRLSDAGYAVETAVDGEDALARARHNPPDAILSDVLMPKLDGYGLCRAVRQDPRLAHLPVVLASSAYVEQEDRDLAVKMGADALVTRTPDLGAVIAALETSRSPERVAPRVIVHEHTTTAHLQRVVHQLERQLAMTATLAQRNAALAAQVAAIDGISRVLVRTADSNQAVEEVLARCLEAGGVSEGALYLRNPGGALSLRASIGFAGVRRALVEMFFGHPDLLDQLITAHAALALPSAAVPETAGREILERSGVAGLVIARIPGDGLPMGALVMGSDRAGLDTEEWLTFARVVGTQLGNALAFTQIQEQARQAQKMEAVGRLAGGVAHDFNNLLTVILGYVDLMSDDLPEEGRARQDLAEVRKATTQAASLTKQLLAFSRHQLLQTAVLTVNDLVEDLRKMLVRLIGEDVELRLKLHPDAGNVCADPGQLQQVLMNLVVNARDAMPTGGTLRIETAPVELPGPHGPPREPVVPGKYVLLSVSDTGSGMDAETQARIFEPFFTTKEQGLGTGLGLSTVYGIVHQSEGYIRVESEPGRGATFTICLPAVDAPADGLAVAAEPAATLTGTETVLVAEDDAMLRPLVTGLLQRHGYRVLVAQNADEALAIAHDHISAVHLLLTDVVMPGKSGRDLALGLAELRPETRVLYMSGYTDDAMASHGVLEPGLAFLQKPFTPTALMRKVREVLDAS